ncbi:hypothetical protein WISP_22615 [Willisornis vidua]|uniref:Uncharacterized protein n=1 Tax=Willisornis vidua TaxID=1566151 RepID=A0ABQ9DQU0_9PASS|nr:hypothetical protein WISP_22615 [Willisornis vidua]
MKKLLEDPLGLAEELDQFLSPNTYTWDELQLPRDVMSSGEKMWVTGAKEETFEVDIVKELRVEGNGRVVFGDFLLIPMLG